MHKSKILLILLALLMLFTPSCGFLEGVSNEDFVITDVKFVKEVGNSIIIPLDQIPEKYRENFKGTVVVVTRKENLNPLDAPHIPFSTVKEDWDSEGVRTFLETLLAGFGSSVPWLAGLVGILGVLFPRSRKHYGSAIKSLATLKIGDGITSIAKGLGLMHSSEESKKVVEEEAESKAVLLSEAAG